MVVRFQMQENVFLLFHFYHIFRYHCYIILAPDSKVHKHQIYSLLTKSCFQRYTVFVFWHALEDVHVFVYWCQTSKAVWFVRSKGQ